MPERGLPPAGGTDPAVHPVPEDLPDVDDTWQPSDTAEVLERRFAGHLRERGRSRLGFPHLLIRGAPSDTGGRPLWEPTPCWLSPDIHLIPSGRDEPLDLTQTVHSPRVGQSYTVAVHIWNLGRFPAYGVTVRVWWVEPGFFDGTPDPRYNPHFIGGQFVELGDRDSPTAHDIVKLPKWTVSDSDSKGHQCLFAVVDAFSDHWAGSFSANTDRHVAQRNLTLLRGDVDAANILNFLGTNTNPGEQLTLSFGELRPASLQAPMSRGKAQEDSAPLGRGPLTFGQPQRIAQLVRTDGDWLTDRLTTTPELGSLQTDDLAEAVQLLLGATGTTASRLHASLASAGELYAALHLTTKTAGYTVLLQR